MRRGSTLPEHSISPLDGDLTKRVIGVFYIVYNELGYGLLEAVYCNAMLLALNDGGIAAQREVPIDIAFRGRRVGHYRADLMVEECLLLECKATPALSRNDGRQIINMLKACPIELGLLLHLGPRPQVFRFISTNNPLSAD